MESTEKELELEKSLLETKNITKSQEYLEKRDTKEISYKENSEQIN